MDYAPLGMTSHWTLLDGPPPQFERVSETLKLGLIFRWSLSDHNLIDTHRKRKEKNKNFVCNHLKDYSPSLLVLPWRCFDSRLVEKRRFLIDSSHFYWIQPELDWNAETSRSSFYFQGVPSSRWASKSLLFFFFYGGVYFEFFEERGNATKFETTFTLWAVLLPFYFWIEQRVASP